MSANYNDDNERMTPKSIKNLERIKKLVRASYDYFQPNYKRYSNFMKFTFKTTLSDSDLTLSDALNQPQVECPLGEAYVSRQRGEFSKQEPSISVMSNDDGRPIDTEMLDFIEGHMRYILFEANNNSFEYYTYTDGLGGGFCVAKVWTEYTNELSFAQDIKIGRCDPLMVGFDPMAQLPHKGDGDFSFEIIVMSRKEFERTYPDVDISQIKFNNAFQDFCWGFKTSQEDMILLCVFFEKKRKKKKIVQLANNRVLTMEEYKEYLEKWELEGRIAQPAAIINERMTEITGICRYIIIESEVLDYKETDYSHLPHIYGGGNSLLLRDPDSKTVEELAKPYLYNIYDMQKTKNLALRTLTNQLENIVQHKWKVAKESIPDEDDYRRAYTNVQNANTLVYNAFLETNPASDAPPVPIPPPQEIPLVGLPSEVMQLFQITDQTIQAILGSYDASLGINDNQLSGIAIAEAATQSNAAAMPYIVSYLQMLNQAAQIILDLIPKYLKTPRTVPVIDKNGQRGYVKINGADGLRVDYSPRELNVRVEAGVNFSIQKNRALQQIIALSKASQEFGQFMNQKGLPIILDNLEIRGIDKLKKSAQEWMDEQAQAAKNQPPNPMVVKAQADMLRAQSNAKQVGINAQLKQKELQDRAMKDQEESNIKKMQAQNEAMEIQNEAKATQNDTMRILLEAQSDAKDDAVKLVKAHTEREVKAMDLAMQHHDMAHRHAKETIEMHHEINKEAESKQGIKE